MSESQNNYGFNMDNVSFANFCDLKRYEITYKPRVIQLLNQIKNDEIIKNPIIWDKNRKLLIDGHHRIEALTLLGFDKIPAYHVDYLSDQVNVQPWYRIISHVSQKRILQVFDFLKVEQKDAKEFAGKKWVVSIKVLGDQMIASKQFNTCKDATEFVDWFFQICRKDGFKTDLTASLNEKKWINSNSVCVFISPTIGKKEVLFATEEKFLFPPQVNRHIINNRLINLSFPLANLTSINYAEKLLTVLNHGKYKQNPGGAWFDGRYYQEKTIQLINS